MTPPRRRTPARTTGSGGRPASLFAPSPAWARAEAGSGIVTGVEEEDLIPFTPTQANGEPVEIAAGCAQGMMCFWNGFYAEGHVFHLRTEDSTFDNNACPGCVTAKHPGSNGTWGDQLSSFQNLSGRRYCFYFETGFHVLMLSISGSDRRAFNIGVVRLTDGASSARPC